MEKGTEKKDVAIFGLWWSSNYGSLMTYYALYRVIKEMGYSVTFIDRPGFRPDHPLFFTHGRRFAKENFEAITPVFGFHEMQKLNAYADTFLMGSDQVWNFGISKPYHGAFFLNFLEDDKRRFSYAASFGHGGFFAPEDEIALAKENLDKFDKISVREEDAVAIVNHTFGLKADRVLDPVFIANQQIYKELASRSEAMRNPAVKGAYIAAYILDGTPEKKEAIAYLAEKLQKPVVVMLDGTMSHFEENKQKLGMEDTVENLQVEDWLYYIQNCSYLITDSCHGASFAILNQKPFVCIGNESRGQSRFQSLSHVFRLEHRFVAHAGEILEKKELLRDIDYRQSWQILEKERVRSCTWLKEALQADVLPIGKKGNEYVPPRRPLYHLAVKIYRKFVKPIRQKWWIV